MAHRHTRPPEHPTGCSGSSSLAVDIKQAKSRRTISGTPKTPQIFHQTRDARKKSAKTGRPLAPRGGARRGRRGCPGVRAGLGTPMGPPPPIPLWPQGSAIVRGSAATASSPWPSTGTPSASLKLRKSTSILGVHEKNRLKTTLKSGKTQKNRQKTGDLWPHG